MENMNESFNEKLNYQKYNKSAANNDKDFKYKLYYYNNLAISVVRTSFKNL